jgi:F-type H+-transporting ATPase subunit delta
MENPRLASRYAKSLLDLAIETNCLELILDDVRLLDSICEASYDFKVMLGSPVISGEKKIDVINAVVKDSLQPLSKSFIHLLMTKGREQNLHTIAKAFIKQYNELKNIRTVKLTTAIAMDSQMKNKVVAKIAGYMPTATIALETQIDEKLIGGFVLEVEDQLFDASVKKKT